MKLFSEIRPIISVLMRHKTGPLLLSMQVALSLAILANAVHVVNLRLESASRPSGVANESEMFRVLISNQKLGGHADQIAMQKQEAATIGAVPGVVAVARTNSVPVSYSGSSTGYFVDRKQIVPTATSAYYYSPDSLVNVWKLKMVEGRDFAPDDVLEVDRSNSRAFVKIAIISKALAEKFFPGQTTVVGKEFYQGTGEDAEPIRVVGVVERIQSAWAQSGIQGEYSVIFAARLSNAPYDGYTVRAAPGQRDRVIKEVDEALRKATSSPINVQIRSMDESRSNRYRSEKGMAWMLLTVSALLILITVSGIVGMSTLWVAQRRKQIGIRRALGASRMDILSYFITENWVITSVGIVCGTALAVALNQILTSQFELPALPIFYLYFTPIFFWALGLAAVFAPAWRAASISPATATRGV